MMARRSTLQSLVEFLRSRNGRVDVNILDPQGEAPIHRLVKKKRKERVELLIALLTNSNADVNFGTARSMTALHFAVEVCESQMVALLHASHDLTATVPCTVYNIQRLKEGSGQLIVHMFIQICDGEVVSCMCVVAMYTQSWSQSAPVSP